jgi:hypothetical protein
MHTEGGGAGAGVARGGVQRGSDGASDGVPRGRAAARRRLWGGGALCSGGEH